jgi:DNA mismatch repair ATPase MutS
MAGIPREVVLRAENLLNALQKKEMATIDLKNQVRQLLESDETPQLSLF